MKNGYARIQILPKLVRLRFEQIREGDFDLLRDKLYHEIPHIWWNSKIRWMETPMPQLNKMLDFCYRELGVGHVKIDNDASINHSTQLPIIF